MFEYTTIAGNRVSINPKYITAFSDRECNNGQCYIYTVDDHWIVSSSYEEVCEHYNNWLLGGLANG